MEDQLADTSQETPVPAWDTRYYIDNPQQLIAPAPYLYTTICTEPDAFTRAGSPAGTAVIRSFDIGVPFTTGTWLADGDTVVVSP